MQKHLAFTFKKRYNVLTYTCLLYTISFKKARKEGGKIKIFPNLHIYNV